MQVGFVACGLYISTKQQEVYALRLCLLFGEDLVIDGIQLAVRAPFDRDLGQCTTTYTHARRGVSSRVA